MKDLLRREIQQLRKTFDFFNERLDFNRKTWWCDERLLFFFKERLDNNSERLDDLMKLRKTSFSSTKDLMTSWKTGLKGTLKVLWRLLLLQQKTWWLDERHVWRELQKLRGTSSSSINDLMIWWKTVLKGTLKS